MSILPVDHVEVGLDRVIDKLNKTNFNKSLQIYLEESQELETQLLTLAEQKSIDLAIGIWLDYIGKIVGEDRKGKSDEEYRIALKIRIGVNRADGTPDIMIDLMQQFTESPSVELREGSIAWGTLRFNGKTNIGASAWSLVDNIKPAGTRWILHSDYYDNAVRFAWEVAAKTSEAFEVTDNGTDYEVFEVTNDGVIYEPFYYQNSSRQFQEGTSMIDAIWAWESVNKLFHVYQESGVEQYYVQEEVDGLFEELVVSEHEYPTPDKDFPFCWEVQNHSKNITE